MLGKKMIDTETELEKIGHNKYKLVSNSMTSMEVRKVRPNEYMFIKVRSSQVRNFYYLIKIGFKFIQFLWGFFQAEL